MNEEIILGMVQPYIKDGAITYKDFDKIFSFLSRKEQYSVTNILYQNGINLIDEHIGEDSLILDVDDEDIDSEDEESFEILYDEALFKDGGISEREYDTLFVNKNVRQSSEILCRLIQDGSRQATQDLCIKNKRLVDKYVAAYEKRYGNRLDFEDLEQVGFLGLIKAAQRFDLKQGTSFSTYAVYWIKQSISREIMDNGYAIRIPVHMQERINKVVTINNRLAAQGLPLLERMHEIACEMGCTITDVNECLVLKNNILGYTSTDLPVGEDTDSVIGDFIPIEDEESVEKIVMDIILRSELDTILKSLTPREQAVLKMRFGWDDNAPRTLEEIGNKFRLTRERIRQIEAKALRKMRHPSRAKRIKMFLED